MYEAYSSGDLAGALAYLDPEVKWDFTEAPDGIVYHGREEVERFWGMLDQVWESMTIEVIAQEERGDTIVNDVRVVGRGRGSGVEVQQPETHVWQVQDGKLVDGKAYLDRAKMPAE